MSMRQTWTEGEILWSLLVFVDSYILKRCLCQYENNQESYLREWQTWYDHLGLRCAAPPAAFLIAPVWKTPLRVLLNNMNKRAIRLNGLDELFGKV